MSKKRKNKKPIYILIGFIVFFVVFLILITRPSKFAQATNELNSCFNVKDVEFVWQKYKIDLYNNEDFLYNIRSKLSSFDLSKEELKSCQNWLPKPPTNINLIVVPDLSRRIIDTINNPNQVINDKKILNAIWERFSEYSKYKENTKDMLIVDVTDLSQAKGQFGSIANDLQFDLSKHKDKSNRFFFTEDISKKFKTNIDLLYASAIQNPLGADYRYYFKRYLKHLIKESTLFESYDNKVIIITDGYLEVKGRDDTKITGYQKQLYEAVKKGTVINTITSLGLNIPKESVDLSNTEVLLCEVNERKKGQGYHYDIIQAYWEDWLNRMNAKKVVIIPRDKANDRSIKAIETFIFEK